MQPSRRDNVTSCGVTCSLWAVTSRRRRAFAPHDLAQLQAVAFRLQSLRQTLSVASEERDSNLSHGEQQYGQSLLFLSQVRQNLGVVMGGVLVDSDRVHDGFLWKESSDRIAIRDARSFCCLSIRRVTVVLHSLAQHFCQSESAVLSDLLAHVLIEQSAIDISRIAAK